MQYYRDILCVSLDELTQGSPAIMTPACYHKLVSRGKLDVVRTGCGRGNSTLIAYNSLPAKYREIADKAMRVEKSEIVMQNVYDRYYQYDAAAIQWYSSYITPGGDYLDSVKVREYSDNASAIEAVLRMTSGVALVRQASSERPMSWSEVFCALDYYRSRYGHTLPDTPARIREKISAYKRDGYASLVSGKYGNSNSRRVDDKIGKLLLMLAARSNQPFVEQIYEDYNSFVSGLIELVDPDSGEVYDAADYQNGKGQPLTLSKRTVDMFLRRPGNDVLIASKRESWSTFYHNRMPHLHRRRPEYSMSKVTFDDRDLPRKERGSKQRPKAYYAYDVCSGVCLGAAYSTKKDVDLVVEMFRDFFRTLDRMGVGMPMQVEVENHLMSQWREGFLRAGEVFPFVRFCAPQNSQEKSAEHFNRGKKIQVEHRYQDGIGRFYAKQSAYTIEQKKVSDAYNNTYEDKQYYSWEELISDDRRMIEKWNNLPHSNQKKYPGMSKLQVFMGNLNPQLQPIQPHILAKYIGEHRSTSLRRNDYCRLFYRDWHISSPQVIDRLSSNRVEAYWMPTSDGSVPQEVHIYQGNRYIDTLKPIEGYQEAICERTGDDWRNMQEQLHRRADFAEWLKEKAVAAAVVVERAEQDRLAVLRAEAEEVEVTPIEADAEDAGSIILTDRDVQALAVGDL